MAIKVLLKDPKDDKKGYKVKTTFEHIFSLYVLDKGIRISVLSSLEEFEQNFRQVMAYTIAEKISVEQKIILPNHIIIQGNIKLLKNQMTIIKFLKKKYLIEMVL
ncbi:Abi family protein [Lactobacillus sp. R2/2]|nr:Abi family protein [Lactobacillus sp. R2/2]